MSSLFTAVEIALADLALTGREGPLDVVVGGLGLGYTAQAARLHEAPCTCSLGHAVSRGRPRNASQLSLGMPAS
jgi:hypothetical protein